MASLHCYCYKDVRTAYHGYLQSNSCDDAPVPIGTCTGMTVTRAIAAGTDCLLARLRVCVRVCVRVCARVCAGILAHDVRRTRASHRDCVSHESLLYTPSNGYRIYISI